MIEELSTILQGKKTQIKNMQFLSTEGYIQPFVDKMRIFKAEFRCLVKTPDQVSITNNVPDIIYNRVHIQAILPESYYFENGYQKVIGMIYALDTKTPIVKFYIGDINMTNGNLVVFNQDALIIQKLESETPIDFSPIDTLMKLTDNNKVMVDQIKKVVVNRENLTRYLGDWLDSAIDVAYCNEGGNVKIASSTVIDAYKALIKDKDSSFYVPTHKTIYLYDVYQAFLNIIAKDEKDILNRFEKTILINRLLRIQ